MPQENHQTLTDQFMAVSLQLSKEEAHPLDRLIQLDERYQRTLLEQQQQATGPVHNTGNNGGGLEGLQAPAAKEYSQMASLPSTHPTNLLDPSHLISTYGQLAQSPTWGTSSWYHPFADSSTTAAAAFLSGYGSAAAASLVPSSPTTYNPYLTSPFGSFSQLTVSTNTTTSQSTVASLALPTSLAPSQRVGLRRTAAAEARPTGGGKMVGSRTLITESRTAANTTTKSSCECPNCLELHRAGIAVDKKKEKHSCHIPGCHKVYGKSSHLKAHLRWHCVERPSKKKRVDPTFASFN